VSEAVDPELPARILDALPVQTILVDADHRVVHANASARNLLGLEPGVTLGEALGCTDVREGACKQGPRCAGCAFRRASERALAVGEGRARGFVLRLDESGEPADLHLLVLASRVEHGGRPHAALVLEDLDRILVDEGVVHICAGCGRVEDDGEWHDLHRYLEDRLGLEVSGEPCADCAAKPGGR